MLQVTDLDGRRIKLGMHKTA